MSLKRGLIIGFTISCLSLYVNANNDLCVEINNLKSLATNYSKNIDISSTILRLEKNQKALLKVVKDKESLNMLKFVSMRLKELEKIKALPATKERIKRVFDISNELIEANNYIKKRVDQGTNLNLASL